MYKKKLVLKVLLLSLLFALIFWVVDAVIHKYYFSEHLRFLMFAPPRTFLDSLIFRISPHILFVRLSFLIICLIGGFFVARYLLRRKISEERYRNYIHGAPIAIFVTNSKGRCIQVNPAACVLTGYSETELIKKSIDDLQNTDGNNTEKKSFLHLMRESASVEEVLMKKDGCPLYIQFDAVTLPEGEMIVFCRDITYRKEAEKELRRNLQEKEILLQEVHHRVKNNLNIISSLIELQSVSMETKKQALEAFEETRDRVFAMAMVHENLYKSSVFSEINMKGYVESLAINLLQIYKMELKIGTTFRINDISIDIDKAIPCGLILNELITNVLKHAFKGKSEGELRISFKKFDNGQYEMIVQDNGIGFPPDLNIKHTESLGLQLVVILTKQLEGEFFFDSENGTTCTILFPSLSSLQS